MLFALLRAPTNIKTAFCMSKNLLWRLLCVLPISPSSLLLYTPTICLQNASLFWLIPQIRSLDIVTQALASLSPSQVKNVGPQGVITTTTLKSSRQATILKSSSWVAIAIVQSLCPSSSCNASPFAAVSEPFLLKQQPSLHSWSNNKTCTLSSCGHAEQSLGQ